MYYAIWNSNIRIAFNFVLSYSVMLLAFQTFLKTKSYFHLTSMLSLSIQYMYSGTHARREYKTIIFTF